MFIFAQLGKKRLKVQVKRSQDDLTDHLGVGEGDGEEEENDGDVDPENLYEHAGFASGETSVCTTSRASTPHAHHQHGSKSNSNSNSNSNASSSDSVQENTAVNATTSTNAQMQMQQLCGGLPKLNLSPLTPSEAEAQSSRDLIYGQLPLPSFSGTNSTGNTTPAHTGRSGNGGNRQQGFAQEFSAVTGATNHTPKNHNA